MHYFTGFVLNLDLFLEISIIFCNFARFLNADLISISDDIMKRILFLSIILLLCINVKAQTDSVYSWIDLGLSVKWASMNIGANSPEEYGNYYAWGEVAVKDEYTWNSYTLCDSSSTWMNKYCDNFLYGIEDNKKTLELIDDAANFNYGGNWRMPTFNEMQELIDSCSWVWTAQNDTNGYLITGPNRNSIFLPAAGCLINKELSDFGSFGSYWTSSLGKSNPTTATDLYFSSGNQEKAEGMRYAGLTIRAVLPKDITSLETIFDSEHYSKILVGNQILLRYKNKVFNLIGCEIK